MRYVSVLPRLLRLLLVIVAAPVVLSLLASGGQAIYAANPDGDLRIEPITAYNFVVDSNVESPSTYGPKSATLGARFCNDGANPLTDVFAYVGNFDPNGDSNPSDSTPGVYPSRTHAPLVGTFSLTHEGGSAGLADATRFVGSILPGECVTQYWLVSYPQLDAGGDAVTGGIKPDDDLWLNYDFWATANDGGAPRRADLTRKATMRNEISAMANKIWPNGDNKVPQQYLDAITAQFGWDTITPGGGSDAYPGELITTQGIWYDLGNVGFGFDNNGDLVPDHNAWLQPIGDPSIYDPGCFRLVRTYGIVVVKLVGGGEHLIPFEDQLYFESVPDNTGAVGLVFYEYVALDGICTAALTPYQEVASGYDNEKFNADFGAGIPPLQSKTSLVTLDKSVDQPAVGPTLPVTLTYTLNFVNSGSSSVGFVTVGGGGAPLVARDHVPTGTIYITGSASASNVLPSGVTSYTILYSHDNGATWSTAESPAGTVTDIQWWLGNPMPAGTSGSVAFQAMVPGVYTPTYVLNTGGLSFGNGAPFVEDDAVTLIRGNNSLGDSVFRDNGSGGLFANGSQDTGETGIANAALTLYYDRDGDGVRDDTDLLWGTTTTNGSGIYSFTSLPDGRYIVVIDRDDPDLPTGWTNSTPTDRAIDLDSARTNPAPVSNLTADFGFAPALTLDKKLAGTGPIYEGEPVQYTIDLTNRLPGSGTPSGNQCVYTVWAAAEDADTAGLANNQHFDFPDNAFGAGGPDGAYASSPWTNSRDQIAGTSFGIGAPPGSIASVEALYSIYLNGNTLVDDSGQGILFFNNTQVTITAFSSAQLNAFGPTRSNQAFLTWNVSGVRAWQWSDFAGASLDLHFDALKSGATDGSTIFMDAIGFRITSNQACPATPSNIIATLPLTDTYDAAQLQFVSAQPPADRSAPPGTLAWDNLGPLYPGQTKVLTVTFLAMATTTQTITNTATTTNTFFGDGRPSNSATDFVTTTLQPTGSLSGIVWNDVDSDGWQGATGYEVTDNRIANAVVTLYACKDANGNLITGAATNRNCAFYSGTWQIVGTQLTDSSGAYRFTALHDGYYRAVVDQATIPGTDTQTGDPNTTPGVCATCDNQSNTTTDNLGAATFIGKIIGANDVTNVNFGYSVPPALYGKVWEDNDGDGARESGENGIGGVTVQLYNNTCTVLLQSTATDANGNYAFGNLTNGTTYCIRTSTGTLPPGGAWTETAESDGSINNQISVAATAGTISGSHDFGFTHRASSTIGDTLYYDWDGDGMQDANEEGIPNITVSLYEDADGDGFVDPGIDALVAVSSTNSSGWYLFSSLPSGNYLVVVDDADPQFPDRVAPSGDPDEAGHCITCDNQSTVSVNGANADLAQDFGYQPFGTGSIGDTVWFDKNGDGVQSGVQEVGLPNITVRLWADLNGDGTYVLIATASTGANGDYLFEDLPNGSYRVIVDAADPELPDDAFGNLYVPTTATTINLTLSDVSPNYLAADFGFTALGAIGDTVWWDSNANGTQDYNEIGIAGVVVTLTNASTITTTGGTVWPAGSYVLTTTTSSGGGGNPVGWYLLDGLAPGRYTVTVDPGGPINNQPQTADPDRDGMPCADNTYPAMPACDHRTTTTLYAGTNFMGADFGYQPRGAFGDTLWTDSDNDGARDAVESGIPYVTVNLYNITGTLVATTTTDTDGAYLFSNLANGSYTVSVNTLDPDFPSGLVQTYDPDATLDSQTTVVIANGAVTQVGTCPGVCDPAADGDPLYLDADFGYRFSGVLSLSGTICLDDNTLDGVCDTDASGVGTGEAAFDGVLAYLYRWNDADTDGNVDPGETTLAGTTTTAANGDYGFNGIASGGYVIAIGSPMSGLTLTTSTGDTPAARVVATPSTGETASAYQSLPSVTVSVSNLDFAFDTLLKYDYGDLPAPYNTTLEGNPDGPRHAVPGSPTLYLGGMPDSEPNGAPSAQADGDGTDEDGVYAIGTWADGANGGTVQTSVTGSGYLVGWIDFDSDGNFTDSGELIINRAVITGTSNYTFSVPSGTFGHGVVSLYARFRLFDEAPLFPSLSYIGSASRGEVEDHLLSWSMTIDKDTSTPTAVAGGTANYSIVVRNTGTQPVANVSVTDTLPSGFTYASSSVTAVNANRTSIVDPSVGDASLTWAKWNIGGGGSVTIDFTVNISSSIALGTYDNTAYATSSQTGTIDDDGPIAQDSDTPVGQDPEDDEDVTVGAPTPTPTPTNTATNTPTNTPVPPTATNTPTNTPVPPTATNTPTNTPVPPTATNTPTNTPVPPTATNTPTNTPVPPTATNTPTPTPTNTPTSPPLRLGNRVWNDLDDDGLYEPGNGEAGIGGVRVELYRDDGDGIFDAGDAFVAFDLTDVDGIFTFENLTGGPYFLHVASSSFDHWVDPLYGFVSSAPTFSSDDGADDNDSGVNNADPANGGVTSGLITLTPGGEPTGETDEDGLYLDDNSNLTVDFGFFELLSLGNIVWFDTNDNGSIDLGETGAPAGVVLELLDGAGNPVLHPVTGLPVTTTTTVLGFFRFTNLYPGDYIVRLAPQNFQAGRLLEGYISSTGSVDPDDDADSDDNGNDTSDPTTNGILSDPITLAYHTEPAGGDDGDDDDNTNLSVDFGLVLDPTAVELLYFRVDGVDGERVQLAWATAVEIDNFGFNLYRAATNDFGHAVKIHFEPSAVKGSGPGAWYAYADTVPHDGAWWYWLADLDTLGRETIHSPIRAQVGVDSGLPFRLFMPVVSVQLE